MFRVFTNGQKRADFETMELAQEWVDHCEAKKKPWDYQHARDLLKSEATEYDLTLVTEEYEVVDEMTGESVTRIKTKKDYEVVITDVTEEHNAKLAAEIAKAERKETFKNNNNVTLPELIEIVKDLMR